MATTQQQYVVSDIAERRYSYSGIATWDGTTIEDSTLLDVYNNSTLLTLTTDYTVDTGTDEIVLDASFTTVLNDVITIKRNTDIDTAYVTFTNNSTTEAQDLNLAVGQNRYKLQELDTDLSNTLGLDTVSDCWDAEGKRICNLGTATSSTDAITLGQVQSIVSGADVADVSDAVYADADGDGSTFVFVPQTDGGDYFPTTDVAANKIIVTINGIVQRPGVDYSYALNTSSRPQVTFLTGSPPTGTGNVTFRTFQGVVTSTYDANSIDGSSIVDGTVGTAELEDGSVTTPKIADDAVTAAKINLGAGVADRFAVFDANGDPTARVLTASDIPAADMVAADVTQKFSGSSSFSSGSPYVYTNTTGSRCLVNFSFYTQNGSGTGTVVLGFSGGGSETIAQFITGGSAQDSHNVSVIVPIAGTVTVNGVSGGTNRMWQITEQEF